jgi:hypothetical protein
MSATDTADALQEAASDLGIIRELTPPQHRLPSRRRGGAAAGIAGLPTLRLVERDDVLFVEEGRRLIAGTRRRSARSLLGKTVRELPLEKLERSQVGAALDKLDSKLTPPRGLRRLDASGKLRPYTGQPSGGVLLLVHGTFSNGDQLVSELEATDSGRAFLRWALDAYDLVLTFDHPTLAVGPAINARELSLRLAGSRASIDVICHSRGGLVTRWWMEGFDRGETAIRRAVFLGSPLAGTGLAAPPNLRATLSLLANVGNALGTVAGFGAVALPFLTLVTGLFQVVSSVTSLVAKTPVVDAAIAMVPGLAAMSRVGNNHELVTLRQWAPSVQSRYFVVQSNFEPDDPQWKFWRWFRKDRLLDHVADAVFDGANDLVVDTSSMTGFCAEAGFSIPSSQILDFGTSPIVHHTNYLRQPKTIAFIRAALG